MTNEELIQLQDTQYEILKAMVDVCDRHQIRYSLAYGTILGSVRHGGSIPWDCDIDTFLDAENFEKFEKVASELPDCYELKAVGGKWNGLSRIYKKNTLIFQPSHGREEAFPIHIDVFKLEYARPLSGIQAKVVGALSRYLMVAKLSKYEKGWIYQQFRNQPLKRLVCRSGDLIKLFASEETMEKWVHDLVVSDRKENDYVLIQDLKKRYPASYFHDLVKMKYEDSAFLIPAEYDKLLTLMYGNYMEFPPESERFTSSMQDLVVEF